MGVASIVGLKRLSTTAAVSALERPMSAIA
jgi:hypothetical protein